MLGKGTMSKDGGTHVNWAHKPGPWYSLFYRVKYSEAYHELLLMEEILHQLIGSFFPLFTRWKIHPRWLFGISSIICITNYQGFLETYILTPVRNCWTFGMADGNQGRAGMTSEAIWRPQRVTLAPHADAPFFDGIFLLFTTLVIFFINRFDMNFLALTSSITLTASLSNPTIHVVDDMIMISTAEVLLKTKQSKAILNQNSASHTGTCWNWWYFTNRR